MTFALLGRSTALDPALDDARHRLREALDRLEGACADLRDLAARTDWRSKGIDALHRRLAELAEELSAAAAQARAAGSVLG
ncbi:ABC-type transporter Mla subunit MlaD [Microbacterium resistens]|uniref:ABC-type transporter Mla subunit MlaD n=1 Tax=Microbacterium resistens TaxID=156977 RepID=A0ABU1SGV7_9MICO|nr:hypothetical protein [Microbacterium resistens]MDR6868843.1 ABC-type transporter Mla subunit MlaD [Microbacterium resistens]